jgi:hypothetical protein
MFVFHQKSASEPGYIHKQIINPVVNSSFCVVNETVAYRERPVRDQLAPWYFDHAVSNAVVTFTALNEAQFIKWSGQGTAEAVAAGLCCSVNLVLHVCAKRCVVNTKHFQER